MEETSNSIVTEDFTTMDASELEGKYLTFWTEKQLYGIPIVNVVQIVQFQEVTAIPESPDYIIGIINLRGSIIPVIDIRIRFGKETIEYTERTCIIVTNIQEHLIGFIVDGVNEVTDIDPDQISDPPSVTRAAQNNFVTGISKSAKNVTLILNIRKLMDEDELSVLSDTYDNGMY